MTCSVKNVVQDGQYFIVVLTLLGVAIYALSLLAYLYLKFKDDEHAIVTFFERPPPIYMFGLPVAAMIAFAIVSILFSVWPPAETGNDAGQLTFSAFNLKFSGPAGPITIWIVVYLSIISSIKLVQDMAVRHEDKKGKISRDQTAVEGKG